MMDPNANLKRQLEIAARLREIGATPAPAGQSNVALEIECCQLAWELAELVDALHAWLQGGGFAPEEWEHAPDADNFALAYMHTVAEDAGADLSNEAVKTWARAEANGLSGMLVRAISAYMSDQADPIPDEEE